MLISIDGRSSTLSSRCLLHCGRSTNKVLPATPAQLSEGDEQPRFAQLLNPMIRPH